MVILPACLMVLFLVASIGLGASAFDMRRCSLASSRVLFLLSLLSAVMSYLFADQFVSKVAI